MEKMYEGEYLKKSLVECSKGAGTCFFICNIISPGFGTLLSGYFGKDVGCCPKCRTEAVVIGFVQAFLTCIVIGWIWSIIHGYMLYKNAK